MKNKLSPAKKRDKKAIVAIPLVLCAGIVALSLYRGWFANSDLDIARENLRLMMGIWATILGFLLTATSILITINNDRFIKTLKDSGDFVVVLFAFMYSCITLVIAISVSIYFVFFQHTVTLIVSVLLGLCLMTITSVIMSLYFLFAVITGIDWNRD